MYTLHKERVTNSNIEELKNHVGVEIRWFNYCVYIKIEEIDGTGGVSRWTVIVTKSEGKSRGIQEALHEKKRSREMFSLSTKVYG